MQEMNITKQEKTVIIIIALLSFSVFYSIAFEDLTAYGFIESFGLILLHFLELLLLLCLARYGYKFLKKRTELS
jgi:hypothetical protein